MKRGPTEHGVLFDVMEEMVGMAPEDWFERAEFSGFDRDELERFGEAMSQTTVRLISLRAEDDSDVADMFSLALQAAVVIGVEAERRVRLQ